MWSQGYVDDGIIQGKVCYNGHRSVSLIHCYSHNLRYMKGASVVEKLQKKFIII